MVRVTVSEGILEGEEVQNEFGGTFYSFKGIPYAQPPVGDLRFKAPQPPKSWEGVRSAKQFGSICYQNDIFTHTGRGGSEDCLYLNVYTPNVQPDKPLPVMFWIHGGALICGSGNDDLYGPEFLIREDVVIVTINYRLEVLGFLCLNSPDIPGNAGMKDQVAALRWVNKNIAKFGGDPKNITIFGESAGGASVSYHLISPMTKGLFKRAITQSGVSLCHWAQALESRDRALALARQLGCNSEDDKELCEFFKKQPLESLVAVTAPVLLSEKVKGVDMAFSVVEEKSFDNQERFFAGDYTSVHEDVEIMIGYTTDEGIINLGTPEMVKNKLELARDFPEFFVDKRLVRKLPVAQQLEFGKAVRKYYFREKIDLTGCWEEFVKFCSMGYFQYPIIQFTKLCAKRNKTYLYRFGCKTDRNLMSVVTGAVATIGNKAVTSHADDILYLFNFKLMPIKMDTNSDTFRLMERVIKLWTNFAKHGHPTPDGSDLKWVEYNAEDKHFMDISNEFVAGTAPDAEDIEFWDNILEKFGEKIY